MTECLLLIGTTPDAAGQTSAFVSMIPFLLILVIFYFVLIRPQQKQVQKHRQFLESLKKGDEVITDSGMFGTVIGVSDDSVVLRIADNVKVKFLKAKVSGRISESTGVEKGAKPSA
jgi:preprotein translocase subunit YajC